MKPKIALIDHSFHKKTHSTDFIREILSHNFEVENFWDESWQGGKTIKVDEISRSDYFVFFQSLLKFQELKKIGKEIVWIPMYDNETANKFRWDRCLYYKLLAMSGVKALCFSKKMMLFLQKSGMKCHYFQYFPKLDFGTIKNYSGKKIYFWDRGFVSFKNIKAIIGKQKIDQLIFRVNYDPNRKNLLPTAEEIKRYNIKIIKGELSRAENLKLLAETNIFIAPRFREGIGMSFLEAMSMGHCVIANNDATMNEYIQHGENGFLTDWDHEVDLAIFEQCGRNAKSTIENGSRIWQKLGSEIVNFITGNKQNIKVNRFSVFIIYTLWYILDKIFRVLQIFVTLKKKV